MQSDNSTHAKMMHMCMWYAGIVIMFLSLSFLLMALTIALVLSVQGKSDSYMTVRSNGGLNQMRTGVSPLHQDWTLSFIFVYLMWACSWIYNYIVVLVKKIASWVFFAGVFWLVCVMFDSVIVINNLPSADLWYGRSCPFGECNTCYPSVR